MKIELSEESAEAIESLSDSISDLAEVAPGIIEALGRIESKLADIEVRLR